jgi:hypothetical protein
MGGSIGISTSSAPTLRIRVRASACVSALECGDGMTTPVTRSGPRASAAIMRTRAESMPPETATRTRSKPFFST